MLSKLKALKLKFDLWRKSMTFETWTKDSSRVVRHYKIRATPQTLAEDIYDVTVTRTKIGGESQKLRYQWSQDEVLARQLECC